MISTIRSNPVSLGVLFLALAAQVPHAQTVFYNASHVGGHTAWWLALTFAIALESAVLMFVVHGWQRFSYVFAGSSVVINMAYYDMLPDVLVKILVSVILPVAIACYSHLVAEDSDSDSDTTRTLGHNSDIDKTDDIDTNDMSRDDTHVIDKNEVTDNDTDVTNPLTAKQRRSQLSEVVIDKNSVTTDDINELSKLYRVTPRTIRRDIENIFSSNGTH